MKTNVKPTLKYRLYNFWLGIRHPTFISHLKVDYAWDSKLLEMLDKYPVEVEDKYVVKLGPHCVWIENYPYGSGRYMKNRSAAPDDFVPSISTRIKLEKLVKQHQKCFKYEDIKV